MSHVDFCAGRLPPGLSVKPPPGVPIFPLLSAFRAPANSSAELNRLSIETAVAFMRILSKPWLIPERECTGSFQTNIYMFRVYCTLSIAN